MKILYLLHANFELPGTIEAWAVEKGFTQVYASPFLGDTIPPHSSFDMIIAMGGPQSPLSLDQAPYLKDEITLIRNAIKAGIPVLGFCLGAQLIGEALGANTERSPFKEVGVFPIELTEAGRLDPLLINLPKEFFVSHWHNDMPGLTKNSVVLAKSAGCPRQIVRYTPRVYGFQCHPEITHQIANLLIQNCAEDLAPDEYVQTPELFLSHDFHTINQTMHLMLNNFLEILEKATSMETK